jgi:hypothetical protein
MRIFVTLQQVAEERMSEAPAERDGDAETPPAAGKRAGQPGA